MLLQSCYAIVQVAANDPSLTVTTQLIHHCDRQYI